MLPKFKDTGLEQGCCVCDTPLKIPFTYIVYYHAYWYACSKECWGVLQELGVVKYVEGGKDVEGE